MVSPPLACCALSTEHYFAWSQDPLPHVVEEVQAEEPEPPPPTLEEQIKAGDKSTTTIKAFIEEQAKIYEVKPELATAIVKAESSFIHNAKNPKSSASGIWQFIDSTFLGYCSEDLTVKNDPVVQTHCALKILQEPGGFHHWDESKRSWYHYL